MIAFAEALDERGLVLRAAERALLRHVQGRRLRQARPPRPRGPARGRAGRGRRGQAQPERLRRLAHAAAGRAAADGVGLAVGPGRAGLAPRVLGDEHRAPRATTSTSTPAASTTSRSTTPTRSPRARRTSPTARSGSAAGCTASSSTSRAPRCRSRRAAASCVDDLVDARLPPARVPVPAAAGATTAPRSTSTWEALDGARTGLRRLLERFAARPRSRPGGPSLERRRPRATSTSSTPPCPTTSTRPRRWRSSPPSRATTSLTDDDLGRAGRRVRRRARPRARPTCGPPTSSWRGPASTSTRCERLFAERLDARAAKDWARSDALRDELAEHGRRGQGHGRGLDVVLALTASGRNC